MTSLKPKKDALFDLARLGLFSLFCVLFFRNRDKGDISNRGGFPVQFRDRVGIFSKKMRVALYYFVQHRELTMIYNSFFFWVSFVLFDD